jgi:hypothetical protein
MNVLNRFVPRSDLPVTSQATFALSGLPSPRRVRRQNRANATRLVTRLIECP